jgi:hypothetical protein
VTAHTECYSEKGALWIATIEDTKLRREEEEGREEESPSIYISCLSALGAALSNCPLELPLGMRQRLLRTCDEPSQYV